MVAIRTMVVAALVVGPPAIAWAQTAAIQIDTAHNTPKDNQNQHACKVNSVGSI